MLDALQSGDKGFYQFHGIQTTVKIENRKKMFVSAKMMDGTEIDSSKSYIGVTTDFLLQGGDDFSQVIGKIYTPRNLTDRGEFRDTIRTPLKNKRVI